MNISGKLYTLSHDDVITLDFDSVLRTFAEIMEFPSVHHLLLCWFWCVALYYFIVDWL
jgi:hypothetical protein